MCKYTTNELIIYEHYYIILMDGESIHLVLYQTPAGVHR